MERTPFFGEEQDPSYRVLLELACLLEKYCDHLVLVGGWCAFFLSTHYAEQGFGLRHVGSRDVDLLINVGGMPPQEMLAIRQLLLGKGYDERPQGFRLVRKFGGDASPRVMVDLMVPDTRWPRRARPVERGMWLMPLDGGSLTTNRTLPVTLQGELPSGEPATAVLNIMDFPAFLTLKGITLGDKRAKGDLYKYQKNAYDIAFVIDACGPGRVATRMAEARGEAQGHEQEELERGLSEIHTDFRSREAGGPTAAAIVYSGGDLDLQPALARRAFEAVAGFLEELRFPVVR